MTPIDRWPVLCLPCLLGQHGTGCDWPTGCECCHPLCIARLTEET